jgi:hypothetical protein
MSVTEIADPMGSEKNTHNQTAPVNDRVDLVGQGSPGVRRIEIINANFRLVDRVCLFLAIFLIAYVYGLDGTVRYTYQVSDPKLHESATQKKKILTDLSLDSPMPPSTMASTVYSRPSTFCEP